MTRIDLGNYSLRIFHTPGHTSGCISIIETTQGLLFSADSVFAGGTLSYIAESGSIGDYLDSLTRLRCFGLQALYPGHGRISKTPIEDIDSAIANAQKLFGEFDQKLARKFSIKRLRSIDRRTLSVYGRCRIMNKIEEYKKEKDGLDILPEVPRYAAEGWEAITDGDKERLKWAGVFFRKQTPGNFMMRVRIPNGITSATQFRTLAEISEEFGKGFCDITTRQQIQLRWFKIENVPEIWRRLDMVGLVSLQTGMDNIRNVVGCPVAGLTPNELFDASPVVRQFTGIFVGKKEYTNLPRKFNVTITACKENCSHAETQDLALTPASKEIEGKVVNGFNVAVGGKMGSGGYRMASPLDLFVTQAEAAEMCSHVVRIFRDHGFRELRTKARLAFLIDDWGVEKFRKELERRAEPSVADRGQGRKSGEARRSRGSAIDRSSRGSTMSGLPCP